MGSDNVEQVWYGLCLIEAVITLFVLSLVVAICRRFLRSILGNRAKPRSAKHTMVHPLGTVQSTRRTVDLTPDDIKRRIG